MERPELNKMTEGIKSFKGFRNPMCTVKYFKQVRSRREKSSNAQSNGQGETLRNWTVALPRIPSAEEKPRELPSGESARFVGNIKQAGLDSARFFGNIKLSGLESARFIGNINKCRTMNKYAVDTASRFSKPSFNSQSPFSSLLAAKKTNSSRVDEQTKNQEIVFTGICNQIADNYTDDDDIFEDEPAKDEGSYVYSVEDLYRDICSKRGQRSLRCIRDQLNSPTLNLSDRLLPRKDIHSLCVLLSKTDDFAELDLSRNILCKDGARSVGEMLKRNDGIVKLELKYCKLSSDGTGMILESLERNRMLQTLDLSGNKLSVLNIKQLVNLLKCNKSLREISLSYCGIDEAGAIILGSMIGDNMYLKSLDLSWNGIRKRGAKAFCDGLAENATLENMNLSWNGLGREGCKALEHCLQENRVLKNLDLTCNRIDFIALKPLVNALVKNETLRNIKLSSNPITTRGAIAMLTAIKQSPDCAINEIDLTEIPVNGTFMKCLAELYDDRPIKVLHGNNLHNTDTEKPEAALDSYDPCMVLFEFMRQKKLRLTDLFFVLDADKSGTITRQELMKAFQAMNLPLSQGALGLLMERLDADESDEIDIVELKSGQKNVLRKAHAMRNGSPEYCAILDDIQEHVKNAIERKRKKKPFQEKDIISQIERAMK